MSLAKPDTTPSVTDRPEGVHMVKPQLVSKAAAAEWDFFIKSGSTNKHELGKARHHTQCESKAEQQH